MALFLKRLEALSETRPELPAYFLANEQISLGEVDALSNRIAHWLGSILPDEAQVIGLSSEVSLTTGAIVLGILKASKVFLGLDPRYPGERLAYMASKINCALVISDGIVDPSRFSPCKVICIDEMLALASHFPSAKIRIPDAPERPAYVVFTSGSTGAPKAVLAPVRQIDNRFVWMWNEYPFREDEVCCQRMPLSYIDFIWEILGPLCAGTPTALLSPAGVSDNNALIDELAFHHVSRIWLLPATLNTLINTYSNIATRLPNLRFWVCTGDLLSPALAIAFYRAVPSGRLYNLYGTSEIWDATWNEVSNETQTGLLVSIGKPIRDTNIYIVDDRRQLVGPGTIGEIAVGGAALALGYVSNNLPTGLAPLTAMISPIQGDAYLTGDMGFSTATGEIFYLGRRNTILFTETNTICLIELEGAIALHDAVMEAAAVFLLDVDGCLEGIEGFYTCKCGYTVSPLNLLHFLRKYIPEFPVPVNLYMLRNFPMTPSGKIDRKMLRGHGRELISIVS